MDQNRHIIRRSSSAMAILLAVAILTIALPAAAQQTVGFRHLRTDQPLDNPDAVAPGMAVATTQPVLEELWDVYGYNEVLGGTGGGAVTLGSPPDIDFTQEIVVFLIESGTVQSVVADASNVVITSTWGSQQDVAPTGASVFLWALARGDLPSGPFKLQLVRNGSLTDQITVQVEAAEPTLPRTGLPWELVLITIGAAATGASLLRKRQSGPRSQPG